MRHQAMLAIHILAAVAVGSLAPVASAGAPGGAGPAGAQAGPRQVRFEVPPGWTVFRGQSGLIVPHPAGWNVKELGDGGFVAFWPGPEGRAAAVIYVQPIVKIEGRASGVVQGLGRIAPELFPDVRVTRVRVVSDRPEVAVGELSFSPNATRFIGAAMCFKEDPQGVLYAIASTADAWPRGEAVMKRVLGLFFYSGRGARADGAAAPAMVPWRDPLEGAFTCPVPQGWKVEGGLKRFGLADTRAEVLATSPDDRMLVRYGDSFIPAMMSLPTQLGAQYGFTEGGWEENALGTKLLIMRYLPAAEFLTRLYLPQRVGQVSNVRIEDLPQISQALMAKMAGMATRVDTAGVHFDAQTGTGLRKGGALISTTLRLNDVYAGAGDWNINIFAGYLAEPALEAQAQRVLDLMVAGFLENPEWRARQTQAMLRAHNINRQVQQETFNIINQAYANRSQSQDRTNENWSRAYRGEVLIRDPTTGETFEVPSGSNYYFRVGADNRFVGTDAPTAPDSPNHWLTEMRIGN